MNAAEFKRRFVPFYPALYRTAFALTGNVSDAEDLLHDAYLKLWQKRDRLGEAALNERYLGAVVKNCYIDSLRSRKWDTVALEEGTASDDLLRSGLQPLFDAGPDLGGLPLSDDPPDPVPETGPIKDLMSLVDKLPARERQLLKAHILEGISYEELSRRTGLTQGNIRQILFRTRNKLKAQWKKITRQK